MKKNLAAFVVFATLLNPAVTPAQGAEAPDNRAVTQTQFKELVRIFKKVIGRMDSLEKKVKTLENKGKEPPITSIGSESEEVVDLENLGSGEIGKPPVDTPASSTTYKHSGGIRPGIKMFFDFLLYSRPGIADLTFDSFHTLLLVELTPTPEVQFSFDVNPSPRYFELDYMLTEKLQLRVGKIWIPFDDMAPHNVFGGRVNVSRLALGAAFLPDIWTDLGVGLKYQALDTRPLSLVSHLYVVNGFRSGGRDLLNTSTGPEGYPSFSDLPIQPDNNRDKAFGGRVAATIYNRLSLGASAYTGRWSSQSSDSYRMNIFGGDAQLRLGNTEIRTGVATMAVKIPEYSYENADGDALTGDQYLRGGAYVELGQKFFDGKVKILGRGGILQLDDRLIDVTDQTLVGGTILWKPSIIQFSLEHSRDLNRAVGKRNYSFTGARIVMAF